MKTTKEEFNQDKKLQRVTYAFDVFREMFYENAQIYGALIHLMLQTKTDEFILTINDRELISENYSVHFLPVEGDDKAIKIELVKHEREDDSEDKATS